LAIATLEQPEAYPWRPSDLLTHAIEENRLQRIQLAGWVRATDTGDFEITHDRLLNWTVAEAIVYTVTRDPDQAGPLLERTAKLMKPTRRRAPNLEYLPLDVMWLLLTQRQTSLFSTLVAACEQVLDWLAMDVLFKELLPTLGPGVVPYLLERLSQSAIGDAMINVNKILDGLCGCEIHVPFELSRGLLRAESGKVKRAGVLLLKAFPAADALDELWNIHVESQARPAEYTWQHYRDSYEDTFGALRECARLNPQWLEKRIGQAEARPEPVHDLAYLVAAVGNVGIWKRCKHLLFQKIPSQFQRSFATCVLRYRDNDETPWIESVVGEKEDRLGPVAFHALARISPARAIELVRMVGDWDLYVTRSWWFWELKLKTPDLLADHLADAFRHPEQIGKYARTLQGLEDHLDVDSFDRVLDWLADGLSRLQGSVGSREAKRGVAIGLEFINAVRRPELLDRLRQRRNTELEDRLAELAISQSTVAPEDVSFSPREISEVLSKMVGSGCDRMLVHHLRSSDAWQRKEAALLARRRLTHEVAGLLHRQIDNGISTPNGRADSEVWIVSVEAAETLAAHQDWEGVLKCVRWLEECLSSIVACRPDHSLTLEDGALVDVLSEFRSDNGPSTGSVACAAFGGRRDLLPQVREALRTAPPGSDLSKACLDALIQLKDTDSTTVAVIERHLVPKQWLPIAALLANGTAEAYQLLLRELCLHPYMPLAVALANKPEHRESAIKAIAQLSSEVGRRFEGFGFDYLASTLDSDALVALSENESIFSLAEEVGFRDGPTGAIADRPHALRVVAMRHPEDVVRIALSRLQDRGCSEPEAYVSLVIDFATEEPARRLLDVIRRTPRKRVARAVGLKLGEMGRSSTVTESLQSESVEERLAACRIAGFLPYQKELDGSLRRMLDDPEWQVSQAAIEAYERLHQSRTAEELFQSIRDENDPAHTWVLFDALADVGDPGVDGHVPWPKEVRDRVSPALASYLHEKIKNRRREFPKELDSKDWK
jgi:hypothetical protein